VSQMRHVRSSGLLILPPAWRDGTPRLASASKDGTCRIWVVNTGRTEHVLSGHKGSVSCVKWGGTGLIYTGSHDKTVRVWDALKGTLVHSMTSVRS